MINKEFNLDKFKKQSAKVSNFLKDKGHSIPKSTIMHALSIFLEEKNWNTLSAILNDKKENITMYSNNMINNNEDYSAILKYLYHKLFSEKFPVLDKKLLNENILYILENANTQKNETFDSFFPVKNSLITKMNLIGDEQILKITLSYNRRFENSSCILFNFLVNSLCRMLHPYVLTSSNISHDILSEPYVVSLSSQHRDKVYLFVPLSIKDSFNKNQSYASGNYYSSSHNISGSSFENCITEKKDTPEEYNENIADILYSLGIENIETSSCFLNHNYIDEFLSTR